MKIKKKLISIYLARNVDRIKNIKKINRQEFTKNIKYYVICSQKKRGFFSLLLFVLNHIKYAKKKKLIPVIDMKYHPTLYNEEKVLFGTKNSWEYYFNKINKVNINNVYKSKNYIFCEEKNIFTKNNKFHYSLKKIFTKNIKINNNILKRYLYYKNKIFNKKDQFLGIHFRGTDMKYSTHHPLPLTRKQVDKKVKYLMSKYNLNKIFLVTEDTKNFNFFINNFKDYKILYIDNFRTSKTLAFDEDYRKNHKYKMGEEALINSLLLSNCNVLISTQTGITDFAHFINPSLKFLKINNGNNSKRIFFSLFKYHVKDFLPQALGGFKV
tara:strand:- start:695 stop:1669 length:975 start_codon:yes stop_codon:yes gene_type:complete